MLRVGIDSYVSLEDAEEYILNHVEDKEKWNTLTDMQKEVFLIKATQNIGKLTYGGKKVNAEQRLEFPRKYSGHYYGGYLIEEVPYEVKNAEIEEALWLANVGSERVKMQKEGVKSFSIGDISETCAKDTISDNAISVNAMELIGKFLIGNVAI